MSWGISSQRVRSCGSLLLLLASSGATLSCDRPREAAADAGPAPAIPSAATDSAAARAGVDRSIAAIKRAEISENVDTLVSYYTEDFLMRRAGEPDTRGREGIRARWEANFAGWKYEQPLFTIDRFTGAGSLAVVGGMIGGTLREKKPGGEARQFEFPYFSSWIRAQDGRWLIRDLMVLPAPQPAR